MKRELKIGIFLAGTLVILATFIFIVGDMSELFKKPGYTLNILVDSALGLEKGSSVKMAGIKIGFVKDILLNRRRAQIVMNIYPQFKVPKGSKATLSSLGLLGERFMDIVPSAEEATFGPGETLEGLPPVSFDQIGSLFVSIGDEVKQLSGSLRDMLNKDTSADLRETLKNLSALASELNDFFAQNKGKLGQTLQSASQALTDIDQRFAEISDNLNKAVGQVGSLADENRAGVKENLAKIKELLDKFGEVADRLNESLEKIRKSEGSLGKLVNEPTLYDEVKGAVADVRKFAGPVSSLKAVMDFRGEYYGQSDFLKSAMSFGLWFDRNKLVQTQIAHDPWGDRFVYSLQGGYRWGGLVPRAGIIESEFGAGLDYYALKEKLALGVEAFNFNRSPRPQFRAYGRYYPGKNIFFVLGVDDFTLASKREVFFGLGVGLR
jgi:phospholipid/cholesterol/gamma-HCH transport system substrate-binding protein